jgi:hypothetical protein
MTEISDMAFTEEFGRVMTELCRTAKLCVRRIKRASMVGVHPHDQVIGNQFLSSKPLMLDHLQTAAGLLLDRNTSIIFDASNGVLNGAGH